MFYNKEFIQALLDVSERLLARKNKYLENEEGKLLAGDYWGEVVDFFYKHSATDVVTYNIYLHDEEAVRSIIAMCRYRISAIEKAEEDRAVDMKYKIKGILYGRISLIISIFALAVSVIIGLKHLGVF